MTLAVAKLETWFVRVPLQFADGSFRPMPEYDAEHGPVLYRAHAEYVGEGLTPRVWFSSYPILRYTPCGVWIGNGSEKDKFVNLRAHVKWGTLTKDEALHHLKRRKQRHALLLSWKLDQVEIINRYLTEGEYP